MYAALYFHSSNMKFNLWLFLLFSADMPDVPVLFQLVSFLLSYIVI